MERELGHLTKKANLSRAFDLIEELRSKALTKDRLVEIVTTTIDARIRHPPQVLIDRIINIADERLEMVIEESDAVMDVVAKENRTILNELQASLEALRIEHGERLSDIENRLPHRRPLQHDEAQAHQDMPRTGRPCGGVEGLRVWHIPQIPCDPFLVDVGSIKEAAKMLDVLAQYDAFQFEHKIKPDYSSAQGVESRVAPDEEWEEWCDDDGDDVSELMQDKKKRLLWDLHTAKLSELHSDAADSSEDGKA